MANILDLEEEELKKALARDNLSQLISGVKEDVLGVLGGTAETARFLPQALGSVIMAAPEAGAAALDWSDRPEWLAPSMTPWTKKGKGVEGMPFWNREQGADQFNKAMSRYAAPQPKTEPGKASTKVLGDAVGLIDWPFAEFGRGVEGMTGSPGLGEGAYWLSSILPGILRPITAAIKKGIIAPISTEAKLLRQGWYSGNPLGRAQHYVRMPAEMVARKTLSTVGPQAAYDAARGFSSATTSAMRSIQRKIDNPVPGADIPKLKRGYVNEVAKELSMRRQYGLEIPPDLALAGKGIFPNEIMVTGRQLLDNPQTLSELTGMQITDEVAGHITPHIVREFNAIERGLPLNLAHKVESLESTGKMMTISLRGKHYRPVLKNDHLINPSWPARKTKTGTRKDKAGTPFRAKISDQPMYAMQEAWDSLMTKRSKGQFPNRRFTAEDFLSEIDELNLAIKAKYQKDLDLYNSGKRINFKGEEVPLSRSKKDGSITSAAPDPPTFWNKPPGMGDKFRQLTDKDGLISWGYEGLTGDQLLGHVRLRTVLDPATGRMFQIGMDQLALGAGKGWLNKITEPGMKNQFISITPNYSSFKGELLTKHGVNRITHGDSALGTRGKADIGMGYEDIQKAAALHKGPTQAQILKDAVRVSGPEVSIQTAKGLEAVDRKRKQPPRLGLLGPY